MGRLLRGGVLFALLSAGLVAPAAADPILMILMSIARNMVTHHAQKPDSEKRLEVEIPDLSKYYPGTMVEPEQIRRLIDDSFLYLSDQQRTEIFDSLNAALLNPRNAAIRGTMIEYFSEKALMVRAAQLQLAKMPYSEKQRMALEFREEIATLNAEDRDQLGKLLRDDGKRYTAVSSIVEIQGHGSRSPVYFVHGEGGGMFWGYSNLAKHLGPDQPIYAFKSRGLDGLPEWSTIEDMAANSVADLRSHQPHGPYLIGGYCFGGVVAYEMARLLDAQGEKVALLALINCSPPNTEYDHPRRTWTWSVSGRSRPSTRDRRSCSTAARVEGVNTRIKPA
jgi:hypothetical protein